MCPQIERVPLLSATGKRREGESSAVAAVRADLARILETIRRGNAAVSEEQIGKRVNNCVQRLADAGIENGLHDLRLPSAEFGMLNGIWKRWIAGHDSGAPDTAVSDSGAELQ